MNSPAPEVGRRMREARGRADLSQAALAARLNVTQTAVSYWEAGRRLPGLDDLLMVADALRVDVGELLPSATQGPAVGAVLRAMGAQVDDEALAAALERFVSEAAKQPAPQQLFTVRAAGARDAAEQLLAEAKATSVLPIPVDTLAQQCGLRVITFDFDEQIDGLLVHLPDGPAVGLDSRAYNAQRRRFTLAHEIGHYLLRHSASFHVDFRDAGGSGGDSPGYNWRHERAANTFAANLLMPAGQVRAHAAEEHNIDRLAGRFDVSRQAMSFRLVTLGLRAGPLEQQA